MLDPILHFVATCRASDLKISTSEVLDCMRHLSLIDLLDEPQFKTTLMTNFVKTRRDMARFEEVYNLFFHEIRPEEKSTSSSIIRKDINEAVERMKKDASEPGLVDALMEYLGGNPAPLLAFMQDLYTREEEKPKAFKIKNNMGQLASRLEIMLTLSKMKNKVMTISGEMYTDAESVTKAEVEAYFNRMLDRATEMLTGDPKPLNDSLIQTTSVEKRLNELGDVSFSSLTPEDVEHMRSIIDQLVRKLKDVASRRYSAKNRGVLDVKKTLRHSAKFQGVPIEIKFKNKALRKGRIITLCDISSSVWAASRFMLNILYALQDCFSKVRSFIFVSAIAEVTGFFEKYEVNEAIQKTLSEADIEYNVNTDYGATFRGFKENYMYDLDTKTTLIIIGDGRSNYMNPQAEILGEMRDKCKRIIWLNPEPMHLWHTGDSEMFTYKAYCHEVRPCQNLNQLMDFVHELVL